MYRVPVRVRTRMACSVRMICRRNSGTEAAAIASCCRACNRSSSETYPCSNLSEMIWYLLFFLPGYFAKSLIYYQDPATKNNRKQLQRQDSPARRPGWLCLPGIHRLKTGSEWRSLPHISSSQFSTPNTLRSPPSTPPFTLVASFLLFHHRRQPGNRYEDAYWLLRLRKMPMLPPYVKPQPADPGYCQ